MNNCPECGTDLTQVGAVRIEEVRVYSGEMLPDKDQIEYGTDGSDSMYITASCATCREELPEIVCAAMNLTFKPKKEVENHEGTDNQGE